ncbi:MAG: YdeI/OmpD-associated family protein [Opitutaceae bacterium]
MLHAWGRMLNAQQVDDELSLAMGARIRKPPCMTAFTATITKSWIMRCAIVPAKIVNELGGWQTMGKGGKGLPVIARYAGEIVETTVSPGGSGRGRLLLQMKFLRRLKLDAGDKVRVELSRTRAPGEPTLPEDLRQALQTRPAAKIYFESVPPSARRWTVRHLEEARKPETRQNRLESIIERFAERSAEKKRKTGVKDTP